jgi:solute carrier family 25 phosphate transporter 23/24/25/41
MLRASMLQFLLYPLDTIRTRLAVSAKGTYSGILDAAVLMQRHEGWTGFYRGKCMHMLRR